MNPERYVFNQGVGGYKENSVRRHSFRELWHHLSRGWEQAVPRRVLRDPFRASKATGIVAPKYSLPNASSIRVTNHGFGCGISRILRIFVSAVIASDSIVFLRRLQMDI